MSLSKIDSNSSIPKYNSYKTNKNIQRINLFDLNSNSNNIIKEEKDDKIENDNDSNNNDNNITNLDDLNNDLLVKEDININDETRQQMNNLFKNLTIKSPSRMKSRKTSKKIPKLSPSPYKVINEEYKLKDFLFNINKNYDNQINFI